MAGKGFASFDTPLGVCGVAWGPGGLIGTLLPELRMTMRARLKQRFSELDEAEPNPAARAAIRGIVAHLGGAKVDHAGIILDFDCVGAWEADVYRAARTIPQGETRTYGALAAAIGEPGAAQAVGQALGRNPWPIIVPCHRITAANGRAGGFSAPGGATTKLKLLEIEGALAADRLPLFVPREKI
jgi:methylated-DNA-[protein]-cysteine S-methyltransferase